MLSYWWLDYFFVLFCVIVHLFFAISFCKYAFHGEYTLYMIQQELTTNLVLDHKGFFVDLILFLNFRFFTITQFTLCWWWWSSKSSKRLTASLVLDHKGLVRPTCSLHIRMYISHISHKDSTDSTILFNAFHNEICWVGIWWWRWKGYIDACRLYPECPLMTFHQYHLGKSIFLT